MMVPGYLVDQDALGQAGGQLVRWLLRLRRRGLRDHPGRRRLTRRLVKMAASAEVMLVVLLSENLSDEGRIQPRSACRWHQEWAAVVTGAQRCSRYGRVMQVRQSGEG